MTELFFVTYGLLWALVGTLVVAVFAMYHHFGEAYLRGPEGRANQGPAIGTKVTPVDVRTVDRSVYSAPRRGIVTMFEFASTACGPCISMKPHLDSLLLAYGNVDLIVFCAGDPDEIKKWSSASPTNVHYILDDELAYSTQWGVTTTPFFVVTDEDGAVVDKGNVGQADLESVLNRAVGDTKPRWRERVTV